MKINEKLHLPRPPLDPHSVYVAEFRKHDFSFNNKWLKYILGFTVIYNICFSIAPHSTSVLKKVYYVAKVGEKSFSDFARLR